MEYRVAVCDTPALDEANELAADGWRVVSMSHQDWRVTDRDGFTEDYGTKYHVLMAREKKE